MTIKDIKVGMLYFRPNYVAPYNELRKVVAIKENPNAGRAVKEVYGGSVWNEPYGEIVAIGLDTNEITNFAVQSITEELDDYLKIVKDENEYKMLIKKVA